MKVKGKNLVLYFAGFCIPVFILLMVMAILQITPFGNKVALLWDSLLQYKDYYGYAWDVLHGEAGIEYSAAKSLGGEMFGIIGYYFSSPINLLLIFIQKSQIPVFMALTIVLRTGLCGLTCCVYLNNRFRMSSACILLLSSAYGLMEYNVYYCRNLMWLDGVYCLPLVALGVWKLLNEKRPYLLWGGITLSVISNWYTGYMVCLMSGIYFLYEYFPFVHFHPFYGSRKKLIPVGYYIAVMIIAVLSSMAVLLPACMALLGGKASDVSFSLSGEIMFGIIHFLSGFDLMAPVNQIDAPVLFCGTITLFGVLYYFLNPKADKKERLWSLAFLGLLSASFCVKDIYLAWTMFVESYSYYFRFAFVFAFGMAVVAGRGLAMVAEYGLDKWVMVKASGLLLLSGAILYSLGETSSPDWLILAGVFALIGCTVLFAWSDRKSLLRRMALMTTCMFTALELGYNSYIAFSDFYAPEDQYINYTEELESDLTAMDENSGGQFYRFEKNVSYLTMIGRNVATSESLLYGYNSIEHYSSAYDSAVDFFLAKMGYSDSTTGSSNVTETYWNSPILVTDSLLSIRYIAWDTPCYGYNLLDEEDNITLLNQLLLENEYALPLGYNVSPNMGEINYGNNPYENQQMLLSSMLGDNVEVYLNLQVDSSGIDNNIESYQFTVSKDGPVYLYLSGSDCAVYVNDEYIQESCTRFEYNSIYLGDFSTGDQFSVKVEQLVQQEGVHTIYAAQLDTEVFTHAIKQLQSGYQTSLIMDGNCISGLYQTDEDTTIFLSIPYETNWDAYVDGEKAEIRCLGGTFIGIDVSAGEHSVKLVYHTPGLRTGLIISVLAVLSFVVLCILNSLFLNESSNPPTMLGRIE